MKRRWTTQDMPLQKDRRVTVNGAAGRLESLDLAPVTKETAIEAMATECSLGRKLRHAGLYVLIEIVLPGGTLVALLLMLYRRGPTKAFADARRFGAAASHWLAGAIAQRA
jgi:hypothetical protein